MSDLTDRLETAREHVAVEWTEARSRDVQAAMHARRRRRQVAMRALVVTSAAAAVLLTIGAAWRHSASYPAAVVPGVTAPRDLTLRLADGSTITPQDESSTVVLRQIAPDRVVVALDAGSARVDVVGRADRLVTVDARVARIETNGGTFRVAREGERARVSVEHGRVRILWGVEAQWLEEGESGEFPRAPSASDAASRAASAVPDERVPLAQVSSTASPAPSAPSSWRTEAHDGDFERAFRTLHAAGSAAVRDDRADLLLAADVARLSHHPSDAVAPLRRVVREHAADPRAPLAAFTLGRVLLDELGRPAEAAAAFVEARRLGSGGPLEEDALAREVEAWSRAGDTDKARAAAESYVSRYPQGRRLRAVQKFGDLE